MIKYLAGVGVAFLLANMRFVSLATVDRILVWLALGIIFTLAIRLWELDKHYQKVIRNERKRNKAAIDAIRRSYHPFGGDNC